MPERLPRVSESPFADPAARQYDALLIVSFGGPEGMADVEPFLDNVLRGLTLPDPARRKIVDRYAGFGGVSPIAAHTRDLVSAVREELARRSLALPVYLGNRNWHPFLSDTLRAMAADGIGRAAAFVTSMFSSYNGCRRYREDLHQAVAGLERAPAVDRLRYGYNHPGFLGAFTDRVRSALADIPPARRSRTPILFTAHSLPEATARAAPYVAQLREACRLVSLALRDRNPRRWRLVFQSNNARYGGERWLGPDICAAVVEEQQRGARDLVVAPIGFVCDHLEVALDLDREARAAADTAGVNLVRAGTVGIHPAFVAMVCDLLQERSEPASRRLALGRHGPSHDLCPANCCLSGRPGQPGAALGGSSRPGPWWFR